jgi:hypothetical protein
MFSCIVEDTVSTDTTDSGEESQTVDSTNKETEADETKETDKATESVNNGEQNNESNNNSGNADDNTGDDNTGDDNTGDDNTGDDNTGDDNTGDDNTGSGGLGEFVPEEVYYNVTYVIDDKGTLEGEAIQRVKAGESAKAVKAIAANGYVFAGWSDWVELESRQELNVRRDITVFPIFVNRLSTYTVTYETRMGGKVIDSAEKTALASVTTKYVPKDPPLAYTYGQWNDGREGIERADSVISNGKTFVIEIVPQSIDNVPTIEIMTENGTGNNDRLNYKNCTVTLRNADEEDCFEDVSAQLRGR